MAFVANPYSPPREIVEHDFRSSARPAVFLITVLSAVLLLRAFRVVLYLSTLTRWDLARSPSGSRLLGVSWSFTWPVMVLAVGGFCVWSYCANRGVRNLGAEGMFFTPWWSALIGFVPVANLVGPYRAVKEILQASDPSAAPREWPASPVPLTIPLWWSAWLVSVFWNPVVGGLEAQSTLWALVGFELSRGLAALLLIGVVRQVERRRGTKSRVAVAPAATKHP